MNQNGKVRHLFKWERKMGGSLTRGTFFQKWSKSIRLNCTLEVPRPVAHIQWPLFKWHNREVLLLSCSNLPFKWTYWSKNRAPRLKTTRLWRGPVIIVKQENVLYLWYGVPAHVRMHTPVTPPTPLNTQAVSCQWDALIALIEQILQRRTSAHSGLILARRELN